MTKKKKNPFDITLDLNEKDLEELFEPFDPLRKYERFNFPELEAIDEPFDPLDFDYLFSFKDEIVVPILENYFRAELIGADKVPDKGPLIMASNHSGNAFPHDAIVLDGLLWREHGMDKKAKFRSVFSPSLTAVWWMRPYGLDDWWRHCGGVDMTFSNFDYLLRKNYKVIYYPEGIPGIGKGFTRRYQLQHFYSSFVVLASRYNVPIYPVFTVNAEWVNPVSITFKWLDRFSNRLLRIPFFPVPIVFLALLFPFMFYLAFPANMKFVIGNPIDVRGIMKEMGIDHQNPTKEQLQDTATRIHDIMQEGLNKAVEEYGQVPYDIKNWYRQMKSLGWKAFKYLPTGWPYTFIRHYRNLNRKPARNRFIKWLRDADILSYYIPFGWFLLAFFRKVRKPPYGYRGLSKKERREREGRYLWLLDKRPLPTKH